MRDHAMHYAFFVIRQRMLNGEQLARMAQRWRMNKPLTMTIPCETKYQMFLPMPIESQCY
jgi:hypothetical protein